jgi:hypothetical protein
MISRLSRWRFDLLGILLLHPLRENSRELEPSAGIVGHVAGEQIVEQDDLGIGHQHADLGAGQRLARLLPLRDGGVVGQHLDGAVEQAAALQPLHQRCW